MSVEVTYRPAATSDAVIAAHMHRECWREAYTPIVGASRLSAQLDNPAYQLEQTQRWRAGILDGPPRILAVANGEPIGFASAGPSRDDPPVRDLELYALYVREAWYGAGVGRRLLHEVIGDRAASLWVLEANARARGFYDRHGFRADGALKVWTPMQVPEVRMIRPGRVGEVL